MPANCCLARSNPTPPLEDPGRINRIGSQRRQKKTKNEDFRSTLKITYSSDESIPGAVDVLYGDTQKRKKKEKAGKNAFPKTNQTYDELISKSPQFADKYYAGTIALFEHEPGISDKKGGHHTKDHITDGGLERTASFDITSLIKKQRNNPRIDDQIFLNINPEQKYADELANALNIQSISVEHFTITKGI